MAVRSGVTLDGYDARDFGADRIEAVDDWNRSGHTHYMARSESGGQVSWNVSPEGDVANIHMSDRNIPGGRTTVWT